MPSGRMERRTLSLVDFNLGGDRAVDMGTKMDVLSVELM